PAGCRPAPVPGLAGAAGPRRAERDCRAAPPAGRRGHRRRRRLHQAARAVDGRRMMRALFRLPAFWLGLALRAVLIVAVAALAHAPAEAELARLLAFPAGFALRLPAQGLVELAQALGLGARAGLLMLVLAADVAMLLGLRL